MFVIVHSGQTGVERGACIAARSLGIPVTGFMPANGRDELGVIPADIAQHLTACPERGPRMAVRANLMIASAVLVVVPEVEHAHQVPAIPWVLAMTKRYHVPCMVCDDSRHIAGVTTWALEQRATDGTRRIMVTGPRATRWVTGETVGRRLITGLAVSGELLHAG